MEMVGVVVSVAIGEDAAVGAGSAPTAGDVAVGAAAVAGTNGNRGGVSVGAVAGVGDGAGELVGAGVGATVGADVEVFGEAGTAAIAIGVGTTPTCGRR